MVRVYAFYSVGGYKDMYIGTLSQESSSTYYLPLLSIMKKRNNPAEQEHIVALEKLPRVEIINQHNDWGFPDECNKLFSHGGYTIIYKTLCNGKSCLAIRNLTEAMKDEDGRSTPFNMLFIAENTEDNYTLDKVALYCKDHVQEINSVLSPTIVYDASVNGLRVDLKNIYNWICSLPDTTPLIHNTSRVNYIIVSSKQMIDIVIKEQSLANIPIDAIFHYNGYKLQGALKYEQPPANLDKPTDPIISNAISESSPENIKNIEHSKYQEDKPENNHKETEREGNEEDIVFEGRNIRNTELLGNNSSESLRHEDIATITAAKDSRGKSFATLVIDYFERLFDSKSRKNCIKVFSFFIPVEYIQWIILGVAIISFLIGLIF